MSQPREDALAHFGVKGMRWGVRNDRKPTANKGSVGFDPVTASVYGHMNAEV